MDEERVEFEVKLAFLERTVETLNAVVVEQGLVLDRLQQKVLELESRIQAGLGDMGQDVGPHDQKPPHY